MYQKKNNNEVISMNNELYHYGVIGMKWGKHKAKRDLRNTYVVADAEKKDAMRTKESLLEDEYFKKLDANKKTIKQEKKADKYYGSKTEKQLQAEYLQKLDDGRKEIEKMFDDKYGKQTMADAEKYVKKTNAADKYGAIIGSIIGLGMVAGTAAITAKQIKGRYGI